jgi:hypothetical protein
MEYRASLNMASAQDGTCVSENCRTCGTIWSMALITRPRQADDHDSLNGPMAFSKRADFGLRWSKDTRRDKRTTLFEMEYSYP